MQTIPTITMAFLAVLVAIAAVGFTVQQSAYAQLIKDPGASGLTPGEDPGAPGWDPNQAEEDAPGQSANIAPEPCDNCAKEFAPGQEGLKAGIIGPDIKK